MRLHNETGNLYEYRRIDCKRVRFYTQANRFRSHDRIVIRLVSDYMTVYSSQYISFIRWYILANRFKSHDNIALQIDLNHLTV